MKTTYPLSIIVNKRQISEIVISDYYQENHSDITVPVIIELVKLLNNRTYAGQRKDQYEYFKSEFEFNKKLYRLIWLLEDEKLYVGVVNAYRIKKRSE